MKVAHGKFMQLSFAICVRTFVCVFGNKETSPSISKSIDKVIYSDPLLGCSLQY